MKNKGHDYSALIIWASAIVGMIRYAAAFLSSDLGIIEGALSEIVTVALGMSGFFMGILGTLGTTYIFDGWRQKMPATGAKWNNKFIALTVFVFAAFITEVLILVPFTMSRVLHVSVADVLHGGVWWWSTAVVVMPLILIGGVSLGNQIVMVDQHENAPSNVGQMTDKNGQKTAENKTENIPTDWRNARKKLTAHQITAIAQSKTHVVMETYSLSDRTARRWIEAAKRETPPPFP